MGMTIWKPHGLVLRKTLALGCLVQQDGTRTNIVLLNPDVNVFAGIHLDAFKGSVALIMILAGWTTNVAHQDAVNLTGADHNDRVRPRELFNCADLHLVFACMTTTCCTVRNYHLDGGALCALLSFLPTQTIHQQSF